jgi:DNA-binding MarR family transcriptional regulator
MTTAADEPPLARLFAIGYRLLVDGLHDRLRARGWTDVRPAFGFVLLAARDRPTSVSELAVLMGTTKQAASKLVEAMVGAGYVQRGTDARDGRQRPVHLTSRGQELLRGVEQIYTELEQEWADVIGATHVQRMRRDLARVLSRSGELPPVRPIW